MMRNGWDYDAVPSICQREKNKMGKDKRGTVEYGLGKN